MTALDLTSRLIAIGAALWAGLLVMAQEVSTRRTIDDPPSLSGSTVPVDRAIRVSRLALMVIAGTAGAEVIGWWYRPGLEGMMRAVVVVVLLYLCGEAIPRGIAVLAPGFAEATAGAARRTLAPFAPLLALITSAESAITGLMPATPRSDGNFGQAHRDMLQGIFSLQETTVSEAMTPRLDIVALEATATWREVVEFLSRSDHARIPVYDEDLDSIQGIIYAKDITPAVNGTETPPARWQDLIRPAQFVPESKSLTAQLRDFQRGSSRLAIIVDEFGGTSGLITREDVIEEVVGEIHGEYDGQEEPIQREGDDRFWVAGSVALDELSALLGVLTEREDVTTVGGLVYSELGRVPKPGQELHISGFRVVVEQVIRRRIMRVYFERVGIEANVEIGEEQAE